MYIDILLFLIILVIFTSLILRILQKKHNSHREEDEEAEHEIEDYEEQTNLWKKEHPDTNEESDGDDRRDIYNKKTPKDKKKIGYQPKNYRGTDIEIAGFESAKDQKDLKGEGLTDAEKQELNKEIEKDKENDKAPEAPVIDPETIKSGIAATKSALEKMLLEVKENYNATGKSSARDNRRNSIEDIKDRIEDKSNSKDRKPNKDSGRGM